MPQSGPFPLNLIQTPRALRFGIDAFLLSAYACKSLEGRFSSRKKSSFFVELGCGDGTALLALLLKYGNVPALGLDINPRFIAYARENAARLALPARFLAIDVREAIENGLCRDWREKASLALANPPWRQPSEGHRPENKMRDLALWADTDSLAAFARAASFFLRHGGHFCCIIHPASLPLMLKELGESRLGLREILPVSARAGKKALRLLLLAQKNAHALPNVLSPLVLHKENSAEFSEAALAFCPWLAREEDLNMDSSPEKI